jgi:hypothetical protein
MATKKAAAATPESKPSKPKKLEIKDLAGKEVTDWEKKKVKGGWRVTCYSKGAAGRPW